jgi:hypothetical protein
MRIIDFLMNLKYPCNLWKPLKLFLTLKNWIEDEDVTIKQAQFDENKWLKYVILKFILVIPIFHANMTH